MTWCIGPRWREWSKMPMELLELIFKELGNNTVAMARFGTVCAAWGSVASEAMPRYLNISRPMLLAPPSRIFDLSNEEASEIKLPEIRGRWCCTSWKNWMITINLIHPFAINFLHLKSRRQIQLPPATTFQDPPPDIAETSVEGFIYKATPSCSPSDPNCIVMAIHSRWKKLAFCKPGRDERWITLQSKKRVTLPRQRRRGDEEIVEETEINCYTDVIYYKGTFYAIGMLGIVRCDLEKRQASTFIPQIKKSNYYYLVELCGDLVQVLRDRHWPNEVYETRMFEILKLDFEENVWREVETLNGYALLLGHNLSVSVSCKEYPEFEEDCIYFTDDNWEGYFEEERGCHDMGVFNLKTRQIKPIFSFSQVWTFPLFWITK